MVRPPGLPENLQNLPDFHVTRRRLCTSFQISAQVLPTEADQMIKCQMSTSDPNRWTAELSSQTSTWLRAIHDTCSLSNIIFRSRSCHNTTLKETAPCRCQPFVGRCLLAEQPETLMQRCAIGSLFSMELALNAVKLPFFLLKQAKQHKCHCSSGSLLCVWGHLASKE